MIKRLLDPPEKNSFFIFGARGTGKSTWLKTYFSSINHVYIDLLNPDVEESYAKNPSILYAEISALENKNTWIIIDEVQKIPKLLDVVHKCIEEFKTPFVLTGSSARKLKRGSANLLAGRAFMFNMFPLTVRELGPLFNLDDVLQWGSLPQIFHYDAQKTKSRYLRTYAQTYLKEEILVEQLVRKLGPFRQFLEVAAQTNSEIINYSNIAHDINVDTVTVQSYFQILQDTLVGYLLEPYHRSVRKRQRANPKFYFFDLGVKRSLENKLSIPLIESTSEYGKAFEHFIIMEIIRLNHYFETDFQFYYLRTKDGAEIDLIIERPGKSTVLIEIKSKTNVSEKDASNLTHFNNDFDHPDSYLLSKDPIKKKFGNITAIDWKSGIDLIFS